MTMVITRKFHEKIAFIIPASDKPIRITIELLEASRAGSKLGIDAPKQVQITRLNERGIIESKRNDEEIDTSFNKSINQQYYDALKKKEQSNDVQ
jgi:sRNA-binding carbon storage regulator CsrA